MLRYGVFFIVPITENSLGHISHNAISYGLSKYWGKINAIHYLCRNDLICIYLYDAKTFPDIQSVFSEYPLSVS